MLFSDRGFAGVLICLNSAAFTRIEVEGDCISAAAGVPINRLINQAQDRGLGGLEFLAGIPATCGGALMMNAGNRKQGIGNLVKSVTVMDEFGTIRRLNKRQLRFSYRRLNLDRYIILEAVLKLAKRDRRAIKKDITVNLTRKRRIQDLSAKSAGCVFRNPDHRLTAGEMIEACGLKRRRKGAAEISGKHANFIINRNNARARDILYLINLARQEVKARFTVSLQPEVKIIK
jgi:UDP-N-acetylmuramate dehydrogenase